MRITGVLALALLAVSSSAVLVRLAAAPAPVVAFWRLLFSVGLLTPFFLAGGSARELAALPGRDWLWLGVAGVCLGLHLILWFASLSYTSVASSTVLVSAQPLLVALLSSRWLGEAPGRAEWWGLTIAFAGAVAIGWGDFRAGVDPLLGDLLAIAAAFLAALYFACGRRLRPRLGLWGYALPVYLAAAGVAGLWILLSGSRATGYRAGAWWAFLALAVGPMLLGHTGFNWALRHVRAYVVSVLLLLEPIGATALAVLVLGAAEEPEPSTVLGGAAVLAGVWLAVRSRRRAAIG